jgi:hypothetical protein
LRLWRWLNRRPVWLLRLFAGITGVAGGVIVAAMIVAFVCSPWHALEITIQNRSSDGARVALDKTPIEIAARSDPAKLTDDRGGAHTLEVAADGADIAFMFEFEIASWSNTQLSIEITNQ